MLIFSLLLDNRMSNTLFEIYILSTQGLYFEQKIYHSLIHLTYDVSQPYNLYKITCIT